MTVPDEWIEKAARAIDPNAFSDDYWHEAGTHGIRRERTAAAFNRARAALTAILPEIEACLAAERERCAKVADDEYLLVIGNPEAEASVYAIAAAIRALGEK